MTPLLHHITAARGRCIAITAALAVGAPAAVAAAPAPAASAASSTALVKAAQRALGVTADGVVGPVTRRALRRFQRRHDLPAEPITGRRTLRALGVDRARLRTADSAAPGTSALLQRIAQCESGGDPRAVSDDGRYRGKYQFSRATWRAMGGSGDPAKASEATQDRLAAKLLAQAGTAPWPNCA